MINKKLVAIVLAVGLIVLIVIAIGQDKYNQDIAAKLAAEGKSGIAANSPQETIANPGSHGTTGIQEEWLEADMALGSEATMMISTNPQDLERAFDSVSSIDSYQIVQSPVQEPDFILCYWQGQLVARLIFDPRDFPYKRVLKNQDGVLDFVFASSSFNDVVNTLREETRIGMGYKESGNHKYGAIISGPSPIGHLGSPSS